MSVGQVACPSSARVVVSCSSAVEVPIPISVSQLCIIESVDSTSRDGPDVTYT